MAVDPKATANASDVVQTALSDQTVQRVYANGFALGLTNADITVVLQQNAQPIAVLNLSFTLAKTLAQRLGRVVSEFEEKLSTTLVTTDKIDEAFASKSEK